MPFLFKDKFSVCFKLLDLEGRISWSFLLMLADLREEIMRKDSVVMRQDLVVASSNNPIFSKTEHLNLKVLVDDIEILIVLMTIEDVSRTSLDCSLLGHGGGLNIHETSLSLIKSCNGIFKLNELSCSVSYWILMESSMMKASILWTGTIETKDWYFSSTYLNS